MLSRVTFLTRGCLFAALLVAGLAYAQREKVVVLEIAVNDSSPDEADRKRVERLAAAIDEQILTELSNSGRFIVVGKSDIAALIGLERQKQLLGCGEDANSCLAELSGALGSPYVISGALARAGTKLRLDLKLVRADKGEVIGRQGAVIAGEDEVFAVVSSMVKALAATGVVEKPSRAPQVVLISTGGAVAISGVVVLAVQASQGEVLRERIGGFDILEAEQRRNEIYRLRPIGSGLLIGGLVVAAGGLLWLALSAPLQHGSVAVLPLRDGAVATWSTRW